MLNKKKLLLVSILAIFIVAMSLSAVSASKTKSVTFKTDKNDKIKNLKNGDFILYSYEPKKGMQNDQGVIVATYKQKTWEDAEHTQLKKIKVWYKKISKKKGKKTITKSSSKVRYDAAHIKFVKGYKPYKVKVWYKNK